MQGNDQKKYIILKDGKTKFSDVVNDCDSGLCISINKGENLNSVLKKLCVVINDLKKNTGGGGGSTSSARVYNEVLIGPRNGYNAIFHTTKTFQPKTTALFINGQRLMLDIDYLETDTNEITFSFPIYENDKLIIDYNIL